MIETLYHYYLDQAFSPVAVSSPAIWLDAMDAATAQPDGRGLGSRWRNKGLAGVGNAVQATDLRKPKLIASAINSRPALQGRHDGTNASRLDIADHAGLNYTNFTIYGVVQRISDLGANEHIAGKYTTASNQREHRIFCDGSLDRYGLAGSADGIAASTATSTTNTSAPLATAHLVEGTFNG